MVFDERLENWLEANKLSGIKAGSTFEEIKQFAFDFFTRLDVDHDGFLSEVELEDALDSSDYDLRQRAFISFLLKRIDDIEDTYQEEWARGRRGISQVDLQEFFAASQ